MTAIDQNSQIYSYLSQFMASRLDQQTSFPEGLRRINLILERFGKLGSPPQTQTSFSDIIEKTSARYGVDPHLVEAVVEVESAYQPDAVSPAGAQGLMQLMPATAEDLGVGDALDPQENIEGGVKYLSQLLDHFDGNVSLSLAAYNAGPGAVMEYGGIPPYRETQVYVDRVLEAYQSATSRR
jgi:soluble lytic murein transglycosylase-like protein